MAHSIPFDTHAYVKKLTAAGLLEAQAEVQAEAIAELVNHQLATQRDIEELKAATQRGIEALRVSTQGDLRETELRLKHDLTLRLGAVTSAAAAIVVALVKLL